MSEAESNVSLFIPQLPSIPQPFSDLMTSYSGIPPDRQPAQILSLRNRAYAHHPYPCLGRWRFLDLDLSAHPLYHTVLEILSSDLEKPGSRPSQQTIFLDLGCCLGQDLRKLIDDLFEKCQDRNHNLQLGEPRLPIVSKVFGADLRQEFIDIGYELFGDESTVPRSQFIAPADVFDLREGSALAHLDGRVSVLNCTAVFHLFGRSDQKKVADRCLRLLNRDGIAGRHGKKCLVLGAQTANVTAGEFPRSSGKMRYRHNDESWERMWKEVVSAGQWQDVVKGVEVGSELQERSMDSKARDVAGEKIDLGKAGAAVGSVSEEERPKMIGKLEEGFRWQVWWVWVEFY